MARTWAAQDKFLRNSLEERCVFIEYSKEIKSLKKGNQEESVAQQEEWAKRFQKGVAAQLTEKVQRVDKISSEKKRIRQACENYRR